jgi:hypothetical protein
MSDDTETICDRCTREIDAAEAWEGTGEWEGATLCPDCHLETIGEDK